MKLNVQLFASGTIPRTSAPSNGDIQIVWSSTPSGSAENYSTVTASVQVKRRSSGETTGTFSGYLQIDNESVSVKKKFSPLKNEWKTVGTFTKTINHNQDGTKSITIGAYLEQTGTSLAGDYEASSTVNLDTINRISPVSTVSSADMNTTITINTNRYASFTHTIRYVFGGASGTIATNVGDSTTWAIPITLANQIPNSVKSVGTIYCDTYNGSTYIGTSSQEIVLSVPSSVVPSVSFTMTKGGNTSLNAWVQNKSQAIINITAGGSYGSSITSYSINGDGYTYNSNPTTTNTLRYIGNQTFYVTATDSRGRTATTTQTIYVEPYSMPTISTAQVQRCNQDGTLNDNGDYCYYVFNGSISSVNSLNKTNTTYKIGYKLSTDANYTYITIDSNKDNITSSGVLSSGGTEIQFNSSNTYDIQFTIEDTYSTSANTIQLTSGFDLMNFNASGKSMAIGEVSQRGANEEVLDVALKGNFKNNIYINDTNILDLIYPVGYIIFTPLPNNYPAIGTWTLRFKYEIKNHDNGTTDIIYSYRRSS